MPAYIQDEQACRIDWFLYQAGFVWQWRRSVQGQEDSFTQAFEGEPKHGLKRGSHWLVVML